MADMGDRADRLDREFSDGSTLADYVEDCKRRERKDADQNTTLMTSPSSREQRKRTGGGQ